MPKIIIILGGGESGLSAALLAQQKGYTPFLSDYGKLTPEAIQTLESAGIDYEQGGHTLSNLAEAELVIKSPGIPDSAEVIQRCEAQGLKIVSEIEFAAQWLHPEQLFFVTGSNGKTTTTTLLELALRAAGHNAKACGNIGSSLARNVMDQSAELYVVELSSFQLDRMYDTRSHISLLLNITPDHLDRYDHSLNNYARSKWRVFQNQYPSDYAILNADDPITQEVRAKEPDLTARTLTFSCQTPSADAYFDGRWIHFKHSISYDFERFQLKGSHNAQNIMAVCLALQAYGIDLDNTDLIRALSEFGGVRHRMQQLGKWRGVSFINDSKGTNLDATIHALSAMPDAHTILILGGTDKGNDYSEIYDLVRDKAKALIYLTLDNEKLHRAFDPLARPTFDVHSMEELFQVIENLDLEEEDSVLLSPACASFDLFKNYEDRGDQFINHFEALQKRD